MPNQTYPNNIDLIIETPEDVMLEKAMSQVDIFFLATGLYSEFADFV